jgi:hypothetical protein
MSTVHDTPNLRPYVPKVYPNLGEDKLYLAAELKAIADALNALIVATKSLEVRIVAGGL